MKKGLFELSLFISCYLLLSNSLAQNLQLNSTWYLQDPTASQFEQASGLSNFHFTVMANDEFLFEYEEDGTQYSETSTWAQIDANNFKFSVTEDSYLFSQFCPGDTFYVTYQVTGATMNMSDLTSNECAFVASALIGSNWLNESALSIYDLNTAEILIYPNPATEIITISSENNETIVSTEFFSANGSKVSVMKLDDFTFDLRKLDKGLYFVYITDKSGLKPLPRPIIVR